MDDGTGGFGSRLRACHESSGLWQQELAERSGLSIRASSKLECGRTRWPYPDSVDRLADALGLRDNAERTEFTAAAQRRLGRGQRAVRPRPDLPYVPRLLPALTSAFVGRASELTTLSRMLGKTGGRAAGNDPQRHRRGGKDRPCPALGAPGRRRVPGRAVVREPARLRPLGYAAGARRRRPGASRRTAGPR